MDGRPILFASPAQAGEINPMLVIAAELSRRGVPDLWFASEEEARDKVAAAGVGSPIEFVSYGVTRISPNESTYASMTRGPMTTDGLVAVMRLIRHPDILAERYPWMLEQIDKINPRLMVIDAMDMPALDAAMTRQVPFVVSVPFPVSALYLTRLPWSYPTPTSGLRRQLTGRRLVANAAYRFWLQFSLLARTNVAAQVRGRRALGIINRTGDPERYSAAASAVFGYSVFGLEYPFRTPEHLRMLGAMVPTGEPSAGELSGWLDEHPSVVYVNMGTVANLTRDQVTALATALADLGPEHRVLWKLPAAQRAWLPETLPAHLRVLDWVPSQLGVLDHPHVRAFVTHGGGNGFHEGIYFGKPLLVLPFWVDCYDFAARAVDAGVGLTIDRPPHIVASEVTAKLTRLLTDETFTRRSRYWGDQLRQAGGGQRAADLILAHRDRAAAGLEAGEPGRVTLP